MCPLGDEVEETEVVGSEAPAAAEVPVESEAPAAAAEEVVEEPEKPEPSLAEKLAGLKEKADAKKAAAAKDPNAAPDPAAAAAEVVAEKNADGTPKFKPNFGVEYRAGDGTTKREEIPKFLQALMKDPESEKEIRDLYTRSKGLDFVKSRYADLTQKSAQVSQENVSFKHSVDELRGIYHGAVQTGNWHRLDSFFDRLQIPQQHIMEYALAKAKLAEMQPEQRRIVEDQISADRRAETIASQQSSTQTQNLQLAQEMKQLQIQVTMNQPDVVAMQQEFETRTGKPGTFEATMRQYGELAWHQSGGKLNLTPRQVCDLIAKDFGLTGTAPTQGAAAPNPAATQAAAGAAAPVQSAVPGKAIVQRTTNTIPNVQGKAGASPLKQKPRSIEDLKKLHQDMVDAEKGA